MRHHAICSRAASTLVLVSIALSSRARAQVQLEWQATYNQPAGFMTDYNESGSSCAVTSSGQVFVAGSSNFDFSISGGGYSYQNVVLSYSPSGVLTGVRRLGTTPVMNFPGPRLVVDASGDSYTAWTQANASNDVVLTKIAPDGHVVWERLYNSGGYDNLVDIGNAVSGDILLSAVTAPGYSLLDYSPSGVLQWVAPIVLAGNGGSLDGMHVAPSGEIVVVGSSNNAKVAKFSSSGAPLWSIAFDMGLSMYDSVAGLDVDAGGFIACCGYSYASSPPYTATLALLDASGVVVWTRTWLPAPFTNSNLDHVVFASDGTLWACGNAPSGGSGSQAVALHFDRAGNLLTALTWPAPSYYSMAIAAGRAGEVRVCGSDATVRQVDSAGHLDWVWTPTTATFTHANALAFGPNDRLAATGLDTAHGGDVRTVQLDLSESPSAYCTPKINSLGCTPNLVFSGSSSASATSGFSVSVANVLNQRSGLLFYGISGANNVPFQGGYLCVQPPTLRTPIANSGGNATPPDDCSGVLSIDMNAFASGALGGSPAPALGVAGTRVWCEVWSRDPVSPSTTNLSSALTYVVLP
jgi:hypothetical protein